MTRAMRGSLTPATMILASGSARRRQLLAQIGITPDVIEASGIDETSRPRELPRELVTRLALAKAEVIATRHPRAFVLGADTVVSVGQRLLPKPHDEASARRCLQLLSGRAHQVLGGIVVLALDGRRASRLVITRVRVKRLMPDEIEDYLSSGEWRGKAGSYAIQGCAAAFVPHINGSYTNVVGLALAETRAMLTGLGFPCPLIQSL